MTPEIEQPESPRITLEEIQRSREVGMLEQRISGEDPRFLLIAYEVYPNGTTSGVPLADPAIARRIGRKTGLGDPSDTIGWGIWEIGELPPE